MKTNNQNGDKSIIVNRERYDFSFDKSMKNHCENNDSQSLREGGLSEGNNS